MLPVATFSIVACDLTRREWGVATQSRFLAAGAVVPWARAEVGALATQAWANMAFGPEGLDRLAAGEPADTVVEALIAADDGRDQRQLGLVDGGGRVAAYTGSACLSWAGHQVGEGFVCLGNILVPGTVEAMAAAYEARRGGPGELAEWLVAALAAGQAAGGDSRGRQSAALLVVREGGSYGGTTDRYLDLRVDHHLTPIAELERLLRLQRLFFAEEDEIEQLPLADVAGRLQQILARSGDYPGTVGGPLDASTRAALLSLLERENLTSLWDSDQDTIARGLLDYLAYRYRSQGPDDS